MHFHLSRPLRRIVKNIGCFRYPDSPLAYAVLPRLQAIRRF
jgi:hypothetical protein